MARFQFEGNEGAPFRGIFYLEEPGSARRNASIVSTYLAALNDRRIRMMEIDTTMPVVCRELHLGKLMAGSKVSFIHPSCRRNESKAEGQPWWSSHWPFNPV